MFEAGGVRDGPLEEELGGGTVEDFDQRVDTAEEDAVVFGDVVGARM